MIKTFNVDIRTSDGAMDCHIAQPDGTGPFAPVILYMDVPGIRQELHDFAARIAREGYLCVLPDLYYRNGRVRFDLARGPEELQRMFAAGSALTNAMIVSDTRGILDWLSTQAQAKPGGGVIGYCMSGQFVVSVAGHFPDRIRAAASLYGVRIVTDQPDSPHLLIPRIAGELYLGFAEHDPYVEDHVIPALRSELQKHGVRHTIDIYPGTEHGFCFPQRPAYNEAAAEQAWTAVFEMYQRTLANPDERSCQASAGTD
ncbi:MAG: dienelactone hydrolase family protein [Pseudomonadales bacterium]|nr:dienelactone hydrolase family protein [Pseudomonadales bacterium]MCP5186019.1 dienelactone hydrolase family protein [Pseudomonadales bacterium]